MKRAILAILLVIGTVTLFAAPEDFSNIVDFSITTADLAEFARTGDYTALQPGKFLILEGSVASTLLVDPNPDTFEAWVELVSGAWQGLEDIEVYRVWVILAGPQFAGRVVERLPRNPGPELILAGRQLLVASEFLGEVEGDDGSFVPVVTAVSLR